MTPSNQIPAVCNYGTSAVYSDYPSPEQMRAGVVPLDSLPAAWWNKMWCASNCAINEARDMVGQIITEVNNVLCQAGINPQAACTDQLYQSINKIRQTLATASVAGAVVSSSTASEVAVDPTTGHMTVNCLGNAASLTTSASTVVGAINELKSTYDCCFSDTATAISGKAPTSHASSATTYGVGSADNYGHLKISDTYTSVLSACSGVAASQKALACVYAVAAAAAAGNVSLGNTAGCALGTAAAGTAITAARSDHVHPTQGYIPYTGAGNGVVTAYQASTAYCGSPAEWASYLIFNHGDGSTYYNQMIRMPFGGVPQYQRKNNGTNSGWKTFITSENIGSQSVSYATSATYADSAVDACCACRSYCVMDLYSDTTPLYVGYAGAGLTCAQVTHLAAFSTNYTTGKTVIKDVAKATIQSWLGLGSAAYCTASAFRANTWWPNDLSCGCVYLACTAVFANSAGTATSAGSATSATKATCAGAYYCDNDVYLCTWGICTCSCCTYGKGCGYICNNNSSPVMFMMPVPPRMYAEATCICGYGDVCWYEKIHGPRPFSLVQIEGKTSVGLDWLTCDNYNPGASCTKIPYRLLGYAN